METVHWLESDLAYLKQLVLAGLEGIDSARHKLDGGARPSPLRTVVWKAAVAGATVGMLSTRLTGNRKSVSRVAMGGLAGSVFGFGAALTWASRGCVGPAARTAIRQMNAARDAHWLESNPIDYA